MSPARLPAELALPGEIVEILRRLEEAGYETWCVGGALRDRLLGEADLDVDLATAARPEDVRRLFRRTVAVGEKHGTVGVLDRHRVLHEVTTFRKDVVTDGRHAVVEFGVSLEEDLARRDFTINALAYHPIRREWRDPFGGLADLLERRVVRAVGDPARRFAEDYLRILRMIRFAARLGFEIDPATWEEARAGAAGLPDLSAERVRQEWFKGLATTRSIRRLVTLWREVGAAAIWLAELADASPFADDAPAVRDPVVLTAGLCRDPALVLGRLRASNEEVARAQAMSAGPPEPAGEGEAGDAAAVRRWLAAAGGAADDLLLLARYRRGVAPPWADAVAEIRRRGEATSRKQLALTGDDLAAAGVQPGPEMGRLLERLLDAVLTDPARNTREGLLELVRSWR
ncbi:MAG TPA: CCA tRNA nucleotidyltransferase [Gemmatimonadales bacterium]|jgi:tRNA nucleotidyltransferase (CCA-adding enzyme)|nr:CCA tRNA nucleotidyltransferase [Gemmatimonadales bacterium]